MPEEKDYGYVETPDALSNELPKKNPEVIKPEPTTESVPEEPKKSGSSKKILIILGGCFGLIILCCVGLLVLGSILPEGDPGEPDPFVIDDIFGTTEVPGDDDFTPEMCTEEYLDSLTDDELTPELILKINAECKKLIDDDSAYTDLDWENAYRDNARLNYSNLPKAGETLTVGNLEITLVGVTDLGDALEINLDETDGFYDKDCSSTNGKYINVEFTVVNNSDKMAEPIFPPIIDSDQNIIYPTDRPFCERERSDGNGTVQAGATSTQFYLYDIDPDLQDPIAELFDFTVYNDGFTEEVLNLKPEDFHMTYVSLEGTY